MSEQTNSWINGLKSRQRKNKASLIVGPSSSFFLYFKSKSRWRCPAQGGALLEEDPPANSHHHTRPQLHNHFLGLYRIFVEICTLLMFSVFMSSLTLFHFVHLSPRGVPPGENHETSRFSITSMPRHLLLVLTLKDSQNLIMSLSFCVIRNFRVATDKKKIFSLFHWHI